MCLFYWRIIIIYLNDIPFILITSIIIALLEGYWDCFTNVLSIYRTIAFFPYFLLGYKFAQINLLDKILIWKKKNICLLYF